MGDNLFEPKNISILQDVLEDRINLNYNPKKFWLENLPPKREPQKIPQIQSFCFVVTDNLKDEAEVLLKTLRLFHNEPVYIICDKASRVFLNRMKVTDNVKFKISAEKEHLDDIQKKVFEGHSCIANDVHDAPSILKKMEVMDFALKHHDNTFFLDTDIIVLDNLQEYFTAEVVLSPHHYPTENQQKGLGSVFTMLDIYFARIKDFQNFGDICI